jgi:endonuclease-3
VALQRHDGTTPTRSERGHARSVWNRLLARYPTVRIALDHRTPWELLVATVLSAQTTDENVNRVTPVLFNRYPTPDDLAEAEVEAVEEIVFSTGFYRQKAAAVVALAVDVVERFDGEVPRDLDQMTTLRGVGRKTASVVLAQAWGDPAVAVDTHVRRVAARLGLTAATDPVKIEKDLKAVFPENQWSGISMRLILFGREICEAKRPKCPGCELNRICPWPDKPT